MTHGGRWIVSALLLALATVFPMAVRTLMRTLKVEEKWPDTVQTLLQCFVRPGKWLVRGTLVVLGVLCMPLGEKVQTVLLRGMPLYRAFAVMMVSWGLWMAIPQMWHMMRGKAQEEHAETLSRFFANSCRAIVVVLAVLVVLDSLGVPVTSLIAGAGVAGLAVSLAAQSTLSSLIAGITLVAEHPFALGDYVVLGEVEGTVEDISLRSTRLRTPDQVLVTVENSKVCAEYIQNAAARTKRLWAFTIPLPYETTAEETERFLCDVTALLCADPEVDASSVQVVLDSFQDSALQLSVRLMALTPAFVQFRALKNRLNLQMMHLLEEQGLSMATPVRRVKVEKGEDV